MMKIVTVIGARPQFIKAAAVSRILRNVAGMCEVMVHTGQHYDDNMSDVFLMNWKSHSRITIWGLVRVAMVYRRGGCWKQLKKY